jgi:hypothetical protein
VPDQNIHQSIETNRRTGKSDERIFGSGDFPERILTAAHHDSIDFLNLAIFNLPVTGAEGDLLPSRRFYAGDLRLYADFEHPEGWHRAKVRQFLDKEFKKHPAIQPIIRRDPPIFTSNHATFFR